MSAFAERVRQDLIKISELSASTGNRVRLIKQNGTPVNQIILELDYLTAPSSSYPANVQKKTQVTIELLSRYPLQEPNAVITTPIYHPNVYDSGKICFGTKWLPSQGLDLLVRRIIQIITFDPIILNEESPANAKALKWYSRMIRKYPDAFPTQKPNIKKETKKKINWKDKPDPKNDKAIATCPNCKTSLRVPVNRKGNVKCPKCQHKFYIET